MLSTARRDGLMPCAALWTCRIRPGGEMKQSVKRIPAMRLYPVERPRFLASREDEVSSVEIFVLNSIEIHYFLNLYHINIYDTLFSFRETIFSIKNNNNNSTFYPLEDITREKAIFLKYLNFSLLKLHPRKRRKKERREKICFNRP